MPGESPSYTEVGQFMLRSNRQLEIKIGQFPRGTKFFFPRVYQGTWFYEQRMLEVRRILSAAGMEIVDEPAKR